MKNPEFIHRKIDHLHYALKDESQASESTAWDAVSLIHDSMPDLNLGEIRFPTKFFNEQITTPFYIAGMTAGHADADQINETLAKQCAERGWIFGLGSQRRELDASFSDHASHRLKKKFPSLKVISNLGIAQLIEVHKLDQWNKLSEILESTQSELLAIHLNPVQEAIQAEGTPNFKGAMNALQAFKIKINFPFILKETGSGMSENFLGRVKALQPFAIDVSGLGGTHWGRVEGLRAKENSLSSLLGQTFKHWGVDTIASLLNARSVFVGTETEIWASGGIRSGLDAAKCLALGADRVGFAKPALEACLEGEESLIRWMNLKEAELRTALFCTNSASLLELNDSKIFLNQMRQL